MFIHDDLTKRAVVESEKLEWVETRMKGVRRRMLERQGAEAGRATTVVDYDPESYFEPHVHSGGEEFIVLQGIFSDEHGDFGPGYYVRNPPGSKHKPFSKDGCRIFVKLWQMDEEVDTETVRIDTKNTEWLPGLVPGLSVMPLYQSAHENVALVKWDAGTVFTPHAHHGGEEIFVLEGTFQDEHGSYPAGTWLRSPHGSIHHPYSEEGCIIYVKTGHLPIPKQD